MIRTAPKLKKSFLRNNRKWFKNRLPKCTRVGWSKSMKWTGDLGTATEYDNSFYVIEISSELKRFPIVAELVLIHEMVHILMYVRKHNDVGHGPKFQKQMLRLARIGAMARLW